MRKLALLTFLAMVPAATSFAATAALGLDIKPPVTVDDQLRATWRIVVSNHLPVAVEGQLFSFDVYTDSSAARIVALPEGLACESFFAGRMDCRIDLAANGTREIALVVQHAAALGHLVAGVAGVSVADKQVVFDQEDVVLGRPYFVRNVDDAGPGSLRQAIEDVNRDCTSQPPCSIVFEITGAVPEEGWFTIRPQSPLPAMRAYDLAIDGASQSRFSGETNPFGGPEIVLDGSSVVEQQGLQFLGGRIACNDLAIGNFPGNGIKSSAAATSVRRTYLGVDASGLRAAPNGSRGIHVSSGSVVVRDSILSGNRRAGGYFSTSSGDVTVRDNFIGVGADGVTPLGNGASGLFFHKDHVNYHLGTAERNVIANNRHAGIALSSQAVGDFGGNEFRDNAGEAIDINIDGPTLGRRGLPGQGGIIGPPVITSARYADGKTTIEGQFTEGADGVYARARVYVYASRLLDRNGNAQGEELIGRIESGAPTFSLTVPGDLRGRYVNASRYTTFVYNWDEPAPGTSELGPARLVD
jgi:hypothetical protein